MSDSRSNLIVNYLPQSLSDHEFQAMFASLGTIVTCKIIRDKTGYSYGYGFVEFQRHQDALRAISVLNGYHLENKVIKVSFARPKGEESKNCKLYIKGVPSSMSESALYELFAPFGEIIQARIPKDGHTVQGVGFVLYSKHSEAESAVRNLNGRLLDGSYQPLSVQFALDDQQRKKPLYSHLQSAKRGANPDSHGPIRPSGNFNRMGHASAVSGTAPSSHPFLRPPRPLLNQSVRPIDAGDPRPPSVKPQGPVVFVYNIGPKATEDDLWQLFAPYGIVQKVDVIYDKGAGTCKGYAFVTMADLEQAKYAIQSLDGYMYGSKKLQVRFKNDKESRKDTTSFL